MAQLLLKRRSNLLIYPGGLPSIDLAHPASKGLQISTVHTGAGVLDLTIPQIPVTTGTASNRIDSILGPGMSASGNTSHATLAGHTTNASQICTMAGIVNHSIVNGDFAFLNSTNDQGYKLGFAGSFAITAGQVFAVMSGLNLVINVPYFLAASVNGTAGVANFVVLQLDNGSLSSIQITFTPFTAGAPSGTFQVGVNNSTGTGSFNGIATTMSSNSFLTLSQLLTWAQNPWAFWYPSKVDFVQSIRGQAAAAATVLMAVQAWGATRRAIEIIGAD